MTDRVSDIPNKNGVRRNREDIPDFGENYVASGGDFVPDFDDLELTVGRFLAFIADSSIPGKLYKCEVDARANRDTLALTDSAVNDVYYDVTPGDPPSGDVVVTTGSPPSDPALKIGEVDTSADTVDDTINRAPDQTVGALTSDSVKAEQASITQVAGKAYLTTTQTINANTVTPVQYDSKIIEDSEVLSVETNNNRLSAKADVTVLINTRVRWEANTNWSASDRIQIRLTINGSVNGIETSLRAATNENNSQSVSTVVDLTAGDTIKTQVYHNSGGARDLFGDSSGAIELNAVVVG